MYYLISFDLTKTGADTRYPLPNHIEVAMLSHTLNIIELKQLELHEVYDVRNDEMLLTSWKHALEQLLILTSRSEQKHLLFPTKGHMQLFHIIKQKCKLKTKADGNGDLDKLYSDNSEMFLDSTFNKYGITSMLSLLNKLQDKHIYRNKDIFSSDRRNKSASRENIVGCSAYSYIADIDTGIFHSKESDCLNDMPFEALRGQGKNPIKKGFIPCEICLSAFTSGDRQRAEKAKNDIADNVHKKLIYGGHAANKNIIGQCYSYKHKGYLTKNLIEKHQCLEKKCNRFKKLKPEYWQAREKNELSIRKARLERKDAKKLLKYRDDFIRQTLEGNGCIKVTSIRETKPNFLTISYIYDRKVDLEEEKNIIRVELNNVIKLKPVRGTREAIEELIKKPRREQWVVTDLTESPMIGKTTKKRLEALGIYCLEDLFGRNGKELYELDCNLSGKPVNRRFLAAYCCAVDYAEYML